MPAARVADTLRSPEGADQDIAAGSELRLRDAAGDGPAVVRTTSPVGWRNAGDAVGGEQQYLQDAIEGREMRRAVAVAPSGAAHRGVSVSAS